MIVFAMTAAACTSDVVGPDAASSIEGLVAAFREQGASVSYGASVPASFFSRGSQNIQLNGGDVSVFEYRTAADANRDAALVAPQGTPIGATQILWVAPPHFFKRDRLVALYCGSDTQVSRPLESLLGPQFAGQ